MKDMDEIIIKNLEVYARHGVFPEENALGQRFIVNARLEMDLMEAGKGDILEKTVNYADICHDIDSFMKENTFKLIEAAAHELSEMLLVSYCRIKKVALEIQKPWAPIGLPLESVGVRIERGRHRAYLSIGSNMGDRKKYLDNAVSRLDADKYIVVDRVSSYIETKPYGKTDQGDFLNAALLITTLYSPAQLLERIHEIEAAEGRVRAQRWGERTLDIDIIFYDDLVMDSNELILPHIDMENRRFVLEPMNEIAPGLVHPLYKKTMKKMLEEIT